MDHNHHHTHNHNSKSCTNTLRLSIMIFMTVSMFLVELIIGEITNSITLKADSFHMLSDVLALIIALVAVRLSKRKTNRNTYGWVRAEIVGALVNSAFLLSICLSNIIEAIKRLIEMKPLENIDLLLYTACFGLLVNIIGLFIFGHGHSHATNNHDHINDVERSSFLNGHVKLEQEGKKLCNIFSKNANLNIRAVFLHVLADALGSVAVIVSALLYKFKSELKLTENITKSIDPILCLCFIVLIILTTCPLAKELIHILMQSVPKEIKIKSLREELSKIDGISSIIELHVWRLSSDTIIASVHFEIKTMDNYMHVASIIKSVFTKYGILSTTIEPVLIKDVVTKEE